MKEVIANVVYEVLEGSGFFLVDLKVSGNADRITVYLDGENGISVSQCAKYSRHIGRVLEEEELIDHAYILEVSSPGVNNPLMDYRQYKRNVNRNLGVKSRNDEEMRSGLLIYADRKGIVLKAAKNKLDSYVYDEIAEAKVVI